MLSYVVWPTPTAQKGIRARDLKRWHALNRTSLTARGEQALRLVKQPSGIWQAVEGFNFHRPSFELPPHEKPRPRCMCWLVAFAQNGLRPRLWGPSGGPSGRPKLLPKRTTSSGWPFSSALGRSPLPAQPQAAAIRWGVEARRRRLAGSVLPGAMIFYVWPPLLSHYPHLTIAPLVLFSLERKPYISQGAEIFRELISFYVFNWRWKNFDWGWAVPLMVQKPGDHHLGCIKPWK